VSVCNKVLATGRQLSGTVGVIMANFVVIGQTVAEL